MPSETSEVSAQIPEADMQIIKSWTIGNTKIELVHETGNVGERASWEFRVDGVVKIYGVGTPKRAREAVFTRRNLAYLG